MAEMLYLAAPYSGSKEQTAERMEKFCQVDAQLMKDGYFTVSPLLKHFTLEYADLPGSWEYWEDYAQELMNRCEAMIVIKLPGWEESKGVQGEIKMAVIAGKPIIYFDPETKMFA